MKAINFGRDFKPRAPPVRWLVKAKVAYLSHHAIVIVIVAVIVIGVIDRAV